MGILNNFKVSSLLANVDFRQQFELYKKIYFIVCRHSNLHILQDTGIEKKIYYINNLNLNKKVKKKSVRFW